ncbi:MAG: hypothetical protein ACREV9_16725 [Burkholderiales bacterium]
MPFEPKYKEVYSEVYKQVCAANKLDCWRVDEISRPGSITRDIVEGIIDAEIIIADLTGRNPNVFYELGIAHSVGNKTIMTAQNIGDVPFDVRNYRVLVYDQTSRKLRGDLDKAIKELLTALDRTSNPFQEVAATRTSIGLKRRTPLVKFIDLTNLPKPMRDWLHANKIVYAEDVATIDLEGLAESPGIGEDSLGRFMRQIIKHDLYPDAESLNRVMLNYRISTRPDHKG